MKKKIPIIIALIAIIAFSIWYGFTEKPHKIYDNNVNTATYVEIGVLEDGKKLQQTLTCEEDTIDALSIKCSPVGNSAQAVVNISVYDTETGKIISTGTDTGANVKPRKMHRFAIEPISGVKGKQITIEITETNNSVGNGVSFYYQPQDEGKGIYLENGELRYGVLVIKTLTERFDIETCVVMFVSIMFIWTFMWFLYRLFK